MTALHRLSKCLCLHLQSSHSKNQRPDWDLLLAQPQALFQTLWFATHSFELWAKALSQSCKKFYICGGVSELHRQHHFRKSQERNFSGHKSSVNLWFWQVAVDFHWGTAVRILMRSLLWFALPTLTVVIVVFSPQEKKQNEVRDMFLVFKACIGPSLFDCLRATSPQQVRELTSVSILIRWCCQRGQTPQAALVFSLSSGMIWHSKQSAHFSKLLL